MLQMYKTMKIKLNKNKSNQIGFLRIDDETYSKIVIIAKKNKVSNQEVVRSILEQVIDQVEF